MMPTLGSDDPTSEQRKFQSPSHKRRWTKTCFHFLSDGKKENDALAGAVYRLNFLQANI